MQRYKGKGCVTIKSGVEAVSGVFKSRNGYNNVAKATLKKYGAHTVVKM